MMDIIENLQLLLLDLADGSWEHGNAFSIETLDNPGWIVELYINNTKYSNIELDTGLIERSDTDWILTRTETKEFEKSLVIYCGPSNLREALEKLISVLESNKN